MYFTGYIAIDPSDITEILPPTKGFHRLAQQMSRGLADEEAERESFTAVSILQRVNMALRSLGITNMIHLSKDGCPVYEDKDGIDNDFKNALIEFGRQTDAEQRRNFRVLMLALEHHGDLLDYLIEVEIVKEHRVGEFPIGIQVNGMFAEFAMMGNQLSDEQRSQIAEVLANQSSHDAVQSAAELEFGRFLDQLVAACQLHMRVDNLHRESKTRILKPKRKQAVLRRSGHSDPAFDPCYDWDDRTAYLPIWSEHYSHGNCLPNGCEVLDEDGCPVEDVTGQRPEQYVGVDGSPSVAGQDDGYWDSTDSYVAADSESAGAADNESETAIAEADDQRTSSSWLSRFFGMDDDSSKSGWSWDFGGSGDEGGTSDGGSCGGCGGGCGGGGE